jgi:hypothetical protein
VSTSSAVNVDDGKDGEAQHSKAIEGYAGPPAMRVVDRVYDAAVSLAGPQDRCRSDRARLRRAERSRKPASDHRVREARRRALVAPLSRGREGPFRLTGDSLHCARTGAPYTHPAGADEGALILSVIPSSKVVSMRSCVTSNAGPHGDA